MRIPPASRDRGHHERPVTAGRPTGGGRTARDASRDQRDRFGDRSPQRRIRPRTAVRPPPHAPESLGTDIEGWLVIEDARVHPSHSPTASESSCHAEGAIRTASFVPDTPGRCERLRRLSEHPEAGGRVAPVAADGSCRPPGRSRPPDGHPGGPTCRPSSLAAQRMAQQGSPIPHRGDHHRDRRGRPSLVLRRPQTEGAQAAPVPVREEEPRMLTVEHRIPQRPT